MTFFVAMLFGAVGLGYFIYGRKEHRGSLVLSGIALCAFPYFVSNLWLVLLLGTALLAVPFVIRD